MKCLTIKQVAWSSITALLLSVSSMTAHAISMDDMVGGYTSTSVSANSRSSKNSRRGFANAGSMRVRFENKPFPDLYHVTLPSFKADCNGLDMNLGSLSWISADEFMDAARALASPGVAIYALSLALNQMCTPCAQEMAKLQDMLNKYQNMLKLSCEEVGTALYEHSGAAEGAQWMEKKLWGEAQDSSQNDDADTAGKVVDEILGDSTKKEMLNGNAVWNHLLKVNTIGGWLEDQLSEDIAREMIMSMSGTTVTDASAANYVEAIKHNTFPAMPPTLDSLVNGESIKGLTCGADVAECLNPKEGEITPFTPMSKTFFEYLDPTSANSITFKFAIHEDGLGLTDDQAAFLEAVSGHMDITGTIRKLGLNGRTLRMSVAEFLSQWIAIDLAETFMLDYVNTSVSVMGNIDDKSAAPEINVYEMRDMYRAEASAMRGKLVEKYEAEANIRNIIDSMLGEINE